MLMCKKREGVCMLTITLILVLGSGLAHAVWNMLAKQSDDKEVFLWVIYAPVTILLFPTLIVELTKAHYAPLEWLMIGLSLTLQGMYARLLALTYKQGDLSHVYPIMRGTATLLIPLSGVFILGESLPLGGWLGISCMLVGFIVMNSRTRGAVQKQTSLKPVLLALCVGLCITSYTLIDKVNLQYISPLALLEVTNIGFLLGLTPSVMGAGRLKRIIRTHAKLIWIGAILSPGSYLMFLFAAQQTDISTVSPLREVGIVFGTLLGLIVLKESQGARRITASIAIVTGIIIIALSGG
jgi:multidrug transporter EmrE-like cation transporter